jgi:transcription termination factor Rho
MYKLDELNTKKVSDLQLIAKKLNIKKSEKLNKEELTYAILDHQAENTKTAKEPVNKQRPITKPDKNKIILSESEVSQKTDKAKEEPDKNVVRKK